MLRRRLPPLVFVFVLLTTLSVLTPKRETILMIAASEFGEELAQTDTAQQIGGEVEGIATDGVRLLRQLINEQLD